MSEKPVRQLIAGSESQTEFYPKQLMQNVLDGEAGENLYAYLSKFNHINVGYVASSNAAYNAVPEIYRKTGFIITYYLNEKPTTKQFIGTKEDAGDGNWLLDSYWQLIDGIGEVDTNSITLNQLSKEVLDLLGKGNHKITNYPDGEDLTEIDAYGGNGKHEINVLKFADKKYNPINFSGLGRKYLRKNLVEVNQEDGTKIIKNVLTQEMINTTNTRYIIQYDYDLNGEEITIPEGCILDFQGGSFSIGSIIFNETSINASSTKQIFNNIKISGTYRGESFKVGWIGVLPSNTDNSDALKNAIKMSGNLLIPIEFCKATYKISKPIVIETTLNSVFIKGNKATIEKTNNTTTGIEEPAPSVGGTVNINVAALFVVYKGSFWTIRDLAFNGGISSSYRNHGLVILQGGYWLINNCNFNYCNTAMLVYNLWLSNITRVSSVNSNIGFYWNSNRSNGTNGNSGTSVCFDNCSCLTTRYGFRLDWLNYSTLNCCAVDDVINRSYEFTNGTTVTLNGCGTEKSQLWISCNESRVILNACQFLYANTEGTNIVCLNNTSLTINNCSFNNAFSSKVIFRNTNSSIILINTNVNITDTSFVFENSITGTYSIYNEGELTVINYNNKRIENKINLKNETKGTTGQRPKLLDSDSGLTYYDSDLGKMILWNGTAWVNMDGTALE